MHSLDLCYAPVSTLSRLFKAKKLSPVDLVQAQIDRIHALQPRLNAFITIADESALADARQAEREIARGDYRGPLHGVTFARAAIPDFT